MAARFRGRRALGGAKQRRMDWGAFAVDVAGLAASGVAARWVLDPKFATFQLTDPTVTRIVGVATVSPAATGGAGPNILLGIIAWPGDPSDLAAGEWEAESPTSLPAEPPRPNENGNFDWLYWTSLSVVGAATGNPFPFVRTEFDVKGQRRLGNGKGLLAVIQEVGALANADVVFRGRVLIKE